MAMILEFPIRKEAESAGQEGLSGHHPKHNQQATAEIVIFPGVRIERWSVPVQTQRKTHQVASGAQAPCRDRLEFLD